MNRKNYWIAGGIGLLVIIFVLLTPIGTDQGQGQGQAAPASQQTDVGKPETATPAALEVEQDAIVHDVEGLSEDIEEAVSDTAQTFEFIPVEDGISVAEKNRDNMENYAYTSVVKNDQGYFKEMFWQSGGNYRMEKYDSTGRLVEFVLYNDEDKTIYQYVYMEDMPDNVVLVYEDYDEAEHRSEPTGEYDWSNVQAAYRGMVDGEAVVLMTEIVEREGSVFNAKTVYSEATGEIKYTELYGDGNLIYSALYEEVAFEDVEEERFIYDLEFETVTIPHVH